MRPRGLGWGWWTRISPARFADIAALIGYLRTIPWSVPELDRESMRPTFAALHDRGELPAITHRFWLSAVKDGQMIQ